jgi:hypothetical protein
MRAIVGGPAGRLLSGIAAIATEDVRFDELYIIQGLF